MDKVHFSATGRHREIGVALRTRTGVRPVFVSCGHRVSLPTAVRLTLACSDGYRIPKPLREADRWVKQIRISRGFDKIQTL